MSEFPLALEIEFPLSPADGLERIAADWPMPLLLESCLRRPGLGEFSFLTADPFATFTTGEPAYGTDPFAELQQRLKTMRTAHRDDLPPFQGGAAGLLCYDLGRCWERLPILARNDLGIPAAVIGIYDWVLAWDHQREKCWLISQGFPEVDEDRRRQRAEQRAGDVLALLGRRVEGPISNVNRRIGPPLSSGGGAGSEWSPSSPPLRRCTASSPADGAPSSTPQCNPRRCPLEGHPGVCSNFDRAGYLLAVQRVIEYIRAGDIFQANVSQQLVAPLALAPLSLYRRLRNANPAPFAGFFAHDDWSVLSSSPERFLQLHGDAVRTRPIKGTRSRRTIPEADLYTRDELRESEKDQAENVMIVDLLRNDLSRVCRPGTMRVPELCTVEAYETVTHLVSEVVGQLQPGKTFWDAIAASFPGGSVTGAPKIRAMEIINELEQSARGPYCGSLFYCGFDGWADSNILIRTITCRRGQAQFPVGGGIVVGSDPALEYEETLHKAAGMLKAVEGSCAWK